MESRRSRQSRAPTEAELDAIPVTREDEIEFSHGVRRVEAALQRARIPHTLEWAIVLVSLSAQTFILQGMGREYFLEAAGAIFEGAAAEKREYPPIEHLREMIAGARRGLAESIAPKAKRVVFALLRGKVTLDKPESPFFVLHAAARVMLDCRASREAWVELCEGSFELGEARLQAMAKATSPGN